jgi:hypothetical protein
MLKPTGLVRDRADGARRLYEVDPGRLAELRGWLDRCWDDALLAFKAQVERPSRTTKGETTMAISTGAVCVGRATT